MHHHRGKCTLNHHATWANCRLQATMPSACILECCSLDSAAVQPTRWHQQCGESTIGCKCLQTDLNYFRIIYAPIKIKSALPPPPKPKIPPTPKTRDFMDTGFSCRKNAFFRASIKLARPFPAPELRTKILRTRGFFWLFQNYLRACRYRLWLFRNYLRGCRYRLGIINSAINYRLQTCNS